MEEYFKQINCEYISIDVFAYNKNAIKFYEKKILFTAYNLDIGGIESTLMNMLKVFKFFKAI